MTTLSRFFKLDDTCKALVPKLVSFSSVAQSCPTLGDPMAKLVSTLESLKITAAGD